MCYFCSFLSIDRPNSVRDQTICRVLSEPGNPPDLCKGLHLQSSQTGQIHKEKRVSAVVNARKKGDPKTTMAPEDQAIFSFIISSCACSSLDRQIPHSTNTQNQQRTEPGFTELLPVNRHEPCLFLLHPDGMSPPFPDPLNKLQIKGSWRTCVGKQLVPVSDWSS